MTAPMENLRALRDELRRRAWVVACFPFVYKERKYFTLVERYVPPSKPPKWYLVKLTFVDGRDISRTLSGPANTAGIDVDVKDVRDFFGVDWVKNPRDFMSQFYEYFGKFIPPSPPLKLDPEEQNVVLRQLAGSDSEDPRKQFCYGVRRNGIRGTSNHADKRSDFNSQKTEMLRPALYARLKNDEHISFLYSMDPEDELSDHQILENFARR